MLWVQSFFLLLVYGTATDLGWFRERSGLLMEGVSVASNLNTGSVVYLLVAPRATYRVPSPRFRAWSRKAISSARVSTHRLGFLWFSNRFCWSVRCGGDKGEPAEGYTHPKLRADLAAAASRSSCVMASNPASDRAKEEVAKEVVGAGVAAQAPGVAADAGKGTLVAMATRGNQRDAEVEEEAFDFDPGVEEAELERRWYAMARYYSGQRSKGLFDEMGVA